MPWFDEAWIASGPDWAALWKLAETQGGFFTNAEARTCGVRRSLLSYYVRRDVFARIHRGVYRLPGFVPTPLDGIRGAWMSTGSDRSVVSHASALFLHGLLKAEPSDVHLTVPRRRRGKIRREQIERRLPRVRLHAPRAELVETEVLTMEGMRVTTAWRAILDTAKDRVGDPDLHEAIGRALARGDISSASLRREACARGGRTRRIVEAALRRNRVRRGDVATTAVTSVPLTT